MPAVATRRRPFEPPEHAARAPVFAALGVLYVVWGSTYLGIHVALRSLPPLTLGALRFLVAGGLLLLWTARTGDGRDPVRAVHWRSAAIVGAGLFVGGNGGVALAETRLPSGLVALLVASMPLWMALFERAAFGERLSRPAIAGLVLGFAGLVLLVDPRSGGSTDLVGALVAVGAGLAWAAGSLYSRGAPFPARPLVVTAMQMLAGGGLLAVLAVVTGDAGKLDLRAVSGASIAALVYLVVVGSWVGFSTYTWLLRVAPSSLVSTYAYVNPIVAVLLGVAFAGERITARTVVAGAIIVAAVALILTARPRAPKPAA